MFAEMTPDSNHTLVMSRKGIERNCCILLKQQKLRSEKICHFSQSRPKDQKHTKSPCFRTCLRFRFKDRTRMEQRDVTGDPGADGPEGSLRELTSKWFIETQVPNIVNNGLIPTWFQGFITRKQAEEKLREKDPGCFLIRLSDKAIGYILSYKGSNRCRHFVINQNETGLFVVYGDTKGHDTVPELIEYYKTRPIEPFGEYLTCSCFEDLNEELYDIIQVSPKADKPAAAAPVAAVRPVKNMRKEQQSPASEQQPTRPSKANRTEELPPLPRRSRHFDSANLNDQDRVLYAQLRKQSPREIPRAQYSSQSSLTGANGGRAERSKISDHGVGRCSPPSGPKSVYSEVNPLDSKSRSLPLLDSISDGEQSYRRSAPPVTPPRLSPNPTRQATNCTEKVESRSRPNSSHIPDYASDTAVYHLAGRPGSPHTTPSDTRSAMATPDIDSVYAEVYTDASSSCFLDDCTYEQLPDHKETAMPQPNNSSSNSNCYAPLEDIRIKPHPASRGLKNDKWKWLFPEAKKKW
ncbi:SH2 domain-containing protein 7-like [Mugil cephalus]|uniref:SH2 domain-containing protein 7-like n=1 Tax=Mugil cephalus TaxID=48193 RepID=UPI001FB7460B|nr:SH2 domain-containing protein 7-like [Mugil cephalus]